MADSKITDGSEFFSSFSGNFRMLFDVFISPKHNKLAILARILCKVIATINLNHWIQSKVSVQPFSTFHIITWKGDNYYYRNTCSKLVHDRQDQVLLILSLFGLCETKRCTYFGLNFRNLILRYKLVDRNQVKDHIHLRQTLDAWIQLDSGDASSVFDTATLPSIVCWLVVKKTSD